MGDNYLLPVYRARLHCGSIFVLGLVLGLALALAGGGIVILLILVLILVLGIGERNTPSGNSSAR